MARPCHIHYDAAAVVKGCPIRTLDARLLAFARVRTTSGAIHPAPVHAVRDAGEVVARGWPLEAGSGWVKG